MKLNIVCGVLAISLAAVLVFLSVRTETSLVSYVNSPYSFFLSYPDSWSVTEGESLGVPYVTISDIRHSGDLTHHDNATHVSVYPDGIPTEGLFGNSKPFNLETSFEVREGSRVFVLEDGTPFAAYILPKNPPKSWGPAGFVWMRVEVPDLQSHCERDGNVVDESTCDPFIEGDTVVHTGSVDASAWETGRSILASLVLDVEEAPIRLHSVSDGDTVESPLVLEGEARGYWFFEGVFPVTLTNWDGLIIAEGYVEARDDWMTEAFVPFSSTLTFTSPYKEGDPDFMKRGNLILHKQNASGLPEHDDALELVVMFEA